MSTLTRMGNTPFLIPAPRFHAAGAAPNPSLDVVSPFAMPTDTVAPAAAPSPLRSTDSSGPVRASNFQRAGCALMVACTVAGIGAAVISTHHAPPPAPPAASQVVARPAAGPSVFETGAPPIFMPFGPMGAMTPAPAAPVEAEAAAAASPSKATPQATIPAIRLPQSNGQLSKGQEAPRPKADLSLAAPGAAKAVGQKPAAAPAERPVTAAVNAYVRKHKMGDQYLIGRKGMGTVEKVQVGLRAGAAVSTAGMAVNTISALHGAAAATQLGAQAQALGAAAQATARTGQLAKAAQMGAQAKSMGAQAVQIGEHAKAAAAIAKPLAIAGGAIAMVDGGIDLYQGGQKLEGLRTLEHVAQRQMAQLRKQGKVTKAVQQDYNRVRQQIARAEEKANNQQGAGAAKMFFGGMMVASPFTGPAAPVVGGIGAVGYFGTTLVEHILNSDPPAPVRHGHHQKHHATHYQVPDRHAVVS